jgi:hypothetical protein
MVSELCREGYFVIAIVKNATESELVYKTITHRYNFAQIETIVGNFESIRSLRQIVLNVKLLSTKHKFDSIYAIICNQEKIYSEFKMNDKDLCYAVAKACTDVLKQYGVYGYKYTTELDTFDFHKLLFIKARALDCLEVRELLKADEFSKKTAE